MNFVELLFGISPDAGNGTFEFVLSLIPVVVSLLLYRRGDGRRGRSRCFSPRGSFFRYR